MNLTKVLIYLLFAVVFVLGILYYRFIFGYLAAAIMFSYLMDPFVNWFERRRIPRWLSILIVYIMILGLLIWFGLRFLPTLSHQGNSILQTLGKDQESALRTVLGLPFIKNLNDFLTNLDKQIPHLSLSSLFQEMIGKGVEIAKNLPTILMKNFQAVIGTLSFLAAVPLLSFFIIKDKHQFRKGILSLIPNRYFELTLSLMNKIDETVGRYFRAMFFEVIVVAIMVSVAFSIVGVPNPILIGVIAGFANIIPYFGPASGVLVAALTILITGANPVLIIWASLAMWIVQLIDNNLVYPVVVGTTIRMHPLIVLLTVIAGGWIGGILWMLISVPLVYIVYSLVRALYLNLRSFKII
ncbi:MAG TPA: AI-2E family transporter [Candidatus Cloacimonadota bacterium]|nr:AI-2E family transporter [Candidatus Cloacimonadota bacterium]HPS38979.1 AI-2E family transporter [Candidatus Cloacimonadota bacterium]